MIRFEHASRAYLGERQAPQGAMFHMRSGEMAFPAGHSDAGKGTLLKLICGTERPSVGEIWFSDHDIARPRDREVPLPRHQISMIFQDYHPLMDHTVHNNAAIPLIIVGASGDDIHRRVLATLDKVGLLDKVKNFPIQSSGDEQQHVGIARVVVNKSAVLLTDEPTSNLNDALSEDILRLFKEFNRVEVTVSMTTHDINLISRRSYYMLTLGDDHLHGGVGHE